MMHMSQRHFPYQIIFSLIVCLLFSNSYCDVFQKCRDVDPSGPLATLRRLLLSEESIESFKKWVISNWFAVVFVIIAVIILLVSSPLFQRI